MLGPKIDLRRKAWYPASEASSMLRTPLLRMRQEREAEARKIRENKSVGRKRHSS